MKSAVLKVLSVIFVLLALLMLGCAITGKGSGALDLSNIIKPICVGIALLSALFAVFFWKSSEE